jgi:hypothetical protein
VKERLVEDWLINVGERGFEIPFCQILLAKGFRILRVSHSPYEHGKDVLAVSPKGALHAYQLKQGDIDLATFEKYGEQIRALVEADVEHPSIPRAKAHRPYLVTTGTIKDPVVDRILKLNSQWKRRGAPCLGYIDRRQLQAEFLSLSSDFWPIQPPKVRAFRGLYLATGRGDLDKAAFAQFLVELLATPRTAKRSDVLRRIAAANIFSSYLLAEFYRNEDYWSIVQVWVITAAHIAWASETAKVPERLWARSFDLALQGAEQSLDLLVQEATKQGALSPHGFELDELTRTRITLCCGAVSVFYLIRHKRTADIPQGIVELITSFVRQGRLLLWGEGAVVHFLLIAWLLEISSSHPLSEFLLLVVLDAITTNNQHRADSKLESPYSDPDEVFARVFERRKQIVPTMEKESKESYTLGAIVALLSRRMLRQHLARRWHAISWVPVTTFIPKKTQDLLLWRCDKGLEKTYWLNQTQSWRSLLEKSRQQETNLLPQTLVRRQDFALMFLLVYPHRASVSLVKLLDSWVSP